MKFLLLLLLVIAIFVVSLYLGMAMVRGELRPWRWHRYQPKRALRPAEQVQGVRPMSDPLDFDEASSTAPWDWGQVTSINEYQRSGVMHPFTCPNDHDDGAEHVLVANPAGLLCIHRIGHPETECRYRQTWVWAWMANGAWRQ